MGDTTHVTRRRLLAASGVTVLGGLGGCQGTGLLGGASEPQPTAARPGEDDTTVEPSGGSLESVESFETGLDHWRRNTGVDSESGVQQSTVRKGTGALALVNIGGPGNDGSYTSLPGDGLDRYPTFGDTVSIWTMSGGGTEPKLGFGYLWQDPSSYSQANGTGYAVQVEIATDRIELRKVASESEGKSRIVETSSPLESGTWYRIVVRTSASGDHQLTLEDVEGRQLGRVSMQDEEWSTGGYALVYSGRATDGVPSYWDELRIRG